MVIINAVKVYLTSPSITTHLVSRITLSTLFGIASINKLRRRAEIRSWNYLRLIMTSTQSVSVNNEVKSKPYLIWFSNDHVNFAQAEMRALFNIFDMDLTELDACSWYGPLMVINLQSETQVRQLLSRSVLIHSCFELWATGKTMEDLHSNLKNQIYLANPYLNDRFKLQVDTYGKRTSHHYKLEIINGFDYLPLLGDIDLTNPDVVLQVLQYFGLDTVNVPENPLVVFFGRWIGHGQRRLIFKLSLKTRKFIANTSMDPLLSLVMSNIALIQENTIILDPFVGTGSLLVAAAVNGAFVLGSDIDYLLLHAKSKPTKALQRERSADESIYSNLKQYGVEDKYLDVLIADAALPLWRPMLKFDAIITDPPYGIREATERIGSEKSNCNIHESHIGKHYPQKISYSLSEIYIDLLNFATRQLVIGGRLVCWIPIIRSKYDEAHLPQNPCLRLVENCEQVLTPYAARRLLVYEKSREPDEGTKSTMDPNINMYKFMFANNPPEKTKKERKLAAARSYGHTSKKGQRFKQSNIDLAS